MLLQKTCHFCYFLYCLYCQDAAYNCLSSQPNFTIGELCVNTFNSHKTPNRNNAEHSISNLRNGSQNVLGVLTWVGGY